MRKEKLERNKRIYLDYAASTPVDDKVLKVMQKAENFAWSNPSSLHQEGERAKRILDEARTAVACYLHCKTGEVFFTSGGTEGANIAIFGVIVKAKEWIDLPHVISSSIEHPAILKPLKKLESNGEIQLTFVNPDKRGLINPETIEKMMKQNTILVCLMHANNEIGTIQPIAKVAAVIKKVRKEKPLDHKEPLLNYPYLLVDAGQSVLYENVSIERLGADIMILDGIKMYGPRGVGILVVRHGAAL
ncbi:MAG: aminotransferase class V-fold PLP-dependent enzyme, partial [Patescibacteria group bacterium]